MLEFRSTPTRQQIIFGAFIKNFHQIFKKKADEQFERLKENPNHPSLRLEKLEGDNVYWSARITRQYRAVALKDAESFVWFLIGKHEEVYNLLNR